MKNLENDKKVSGLCDLLPTYFAVGLLVVIFCVTFFVFEDTRALLCDGASPAKSCFGSIVYDYQTLITGVFAVIAAFATVQAMQRTDRETGKRHEQSVGLSLRPAALEIDRFFNDHVMRILHHISTVHEFSLASIPSLQTEGEIADYRYQISIIENAIEAVSDAVKLENCGDVERHFDGEMTLLAKTITQISSHRAKSFLFGIKISLDVMTSELRVLEKLNEEDLDPNMLLLERINALQKISKEREKLFLKYAEMKESISSFVRETDTWASRFTPFLALRVTG